MGGASPQNSPKFSTLSKLVADGGISTSDISPSPTTNEHHKFLAQVKYRISRYKVNPDSSAYKSSSRHDGNIQHNPPTEEEVPPGRKADRPKHVDPTNSRSSTTIT